MYLYLYTCVCVTIYSHSHIHRHVWPVPLPTSGALFPAAEDYSHFFGGHSALWQCQHSCELECLKKGGHQFGCYDEQHLVIMDRLYGHRSGYTILHDDHYGNIC